MDAGEETKAGGKDCNGPTENVGLAFPPGFSFTSDLHSKEDAHPGNILAKSNKASATSTSCCEMALAVETLTNFEGRNFVPFGFVRFKGFNEGEGVGDMGLDGAIVATRDVPPWTCAGRISRLLFLKAVRSFRGTITTSSAMHSSRTLPGGVLRLPGLPEILTSLPSSEAPTSVSWAVLSISSPDWARASCEF